MKDPPSLEGAKHTASPKYHATPFFQKGKRDDVSCRTLQACKATANAWAASATSRQVQHIDSLVQSILNQASMRSPPVMMQTRSYRVEGP